jgi:hypothetical protein
MCGDVGVGSSTVGGDEKKGAKKNFASLEVRGTRAGRQRVDFGALQPLEL